MMMMMQPEDDISSSTSEAVAALLGLSCTEEYLSLFDSDVSAPAPPQLLLSQQLSEERASKRPRKSALKVKLQQAPTPESVVPAPVEALMMDLSSNDVPLNTWSIQKDLSMRQVAMREYAAREEVAAASSSSSSSCAERRRTLAFKVEQARLFWMAEAPGPCLWGQRMHQRALALSRKL